MPITGGILLGAAIVAKAASFGWLVGIATAPSMAGSRQRFIEHTEEALKSLIELGQGPEQKQLATLRADIALLKQHEKAGWSEPHVFGAASRVSTWKVAVHVFGAAAGAWTLASNAANAAVDSVFPAQKPEDSKD